MEILISGKGLERAEVGSRSKYGKWPGNIN